MDADQRDAKPGAERCSFEPLGLLRCWRGVEQFGGSLLAPRASFENAGCLAIRFRLLRASSDRDELVTPPFRKERNDLAVLRVVGRLAVRYPFLPLPFRPGIL
jgi:hypothetical protein